MSAKDTRARKGMVGAIVCVLLCALMMIGLVPVTSAGADAATFGGAPSEMRPETNSGYWGESSTVGASSSSAIETSAGANTYVLFKSGATGSGRQYSSYGNKYNYDDASLSNGGYDIYTSSFYSSTATARLGLAFTVGGELSEPAVLTVLAYDIDEGEGERDYVYLVDETSGIETKLDGYLSGMNEEWNTTVMYVDQSYFTEGHTYHLKLENAVSGWVSYVRTVSVSMTLSGESEGAEPVGPVITDHSFEASISASGEVSTSLSLSTSEDVRYLLEYAAICDGDQRGSATDKEISVSGGEATVDVSFALDSGSPQGTYLIDVIVKDTDGVPVATYRAYAGHVCRSVTYDPNGGTNNVPVDLNGYSDGDTVKVTFGTLPSRSGYVFLGWASSSTATEAEYTDGGYDTFVIGSSDVTLWAVWGDISAVECPHGNVTYASLDGIYHSAVCADCGYRSVEGHTYTSGTACELCGYVDSDYIARGMCGEDLYWKLNDHGELTITGVGEMTKYTKASEVPWYTYRTLIESVNVEGGAVSITDYTFRGCSSLKSVTLPETVTSIGAHAFYGCSSLEQLILPVSVKSIGNYAFKGCSSLASITLPEGIENIGGYAFYNCSSLTEIRIPASVTGIGSHAFRGCSALTGVVFDQTAGWMPGENILLTSSKLAKPANAARYLTANYYSYDWKLTSLVASGTCGDDIDWTLDKDGVLTLTGSGEMTSYTKASAVPWYAYRELIKSVKTVGEITSIGNYAFRSCTALLSVTLPESVTVVGDYAFYSCSSLDKIDMLGGVTEIGAYAFRGCTSLESIILPETLKSLGEYAFYKSGLTSISIPESVERIGTYAFRGCDGLLMVAFDNANGWRVNGKVLAGVKLSDASVAATYVTQSYYNYEWIHSSIVASGTCGEELTWSLDDDGVLTISGSGDMYSFEKGAAVPWYAHRGSIKTVKFEGSVTSIGDNAFLSCQALESITLPDSITSIGANAFKNCYLLSAISLPDSVVSLGNSAFQGCKALASIKLSADLEEIGAYAFYNCSSLKEIDLPEFLCFIGERAFRSCKALASVKFESASGWRVDGSTLHESELSDASAVATLLCTEWSDHEWSRVRIIASGTCGDDLSWTLDGEGKLTVTGSGAMKDYSSASSVPWYAHRDKIVTVVFKGEITSIGANAFRGCKALESIEMPESVTAIGDRAFYSCVGLTNISIENVKSIGSYAFRGCTGITSFSLSESVRYIGSYAFYGCSGLTAVVFDNVSGWSVSGTSVPEEYLTDSETAATLLTGELCKFDWSFVMLVASGTCGDDLSWTLDENGTLTIFGSGEMTAFTSGSSVPWYMYRQQIKAVVFDGIVTSIEDYAFRGCTSLESIEIPESVGHIGAYAFYGCTSLTDVWIPDSVSEIGGHAFRGCTSLETVTLPEGLVSIGDYAFYGCTSLDSVVIPESVIRIGRDALYASGVSSVTFKDTTTWYRTADSASIQAMSGGTRTDVTDDAVNAGYFTYAYGNYYWYKLYTVTFFTHNGLYRELTGSYGQTLTKPDDPTREGYDFVGWDGTVPERFSAEDISFTAVWQARSFDIQYVIDKDAQTVDGHPLKGVFKRNGTVNSATYEVTTELDTASAYTYGDYYRFIGWCLDADYNSSRMLTDGDGKLIPNLAGYTDYEGRLIIAPERLTLYAQWEQVYSDYTYITTRAEFIAIEDDLDGKYILLEDIDLGAETDWEPFGGCYLEKIFNGVLDGRGHAIKNFRRTSNVKESGGKSYFGLFGCIGSEGVVCNIVFKSVYVEINGPANNNSSFRAFYGVVAGKCMGTISNVEISSEGHFAYSCCTNGWTFTGSICGYMLNGNISHCVNNTNVYSDRYAAIVGGIVGYSKGGSISYCTNNGNVTAVGTDWSGQAHAGGIVGVVDTNKINKVEVITVFTDVKNNGTLLTKPYDHSSWFTDCHMSKGDIYANKWTNDF